MTYMAFAAEDDATMMRQVIPIVRGVAGGFDHCNGVGGETDEGLSAITTISGTKTPAGAGARTDLSGALTARNTIEDVGAHIMCTFKAESRPSDPGGAPDTRRTNDTALAKVLSRNVEGDLL